MPNNKTISVIIPVFNQYEYFVKCINSIQLQTYTNLEIICVDDGSTDGVEKYLDNCARSDKRIVIKHQENRGESSARNVGLSMSTGDYIAFVDCDDYIDPDMYQCLVEKAEREDLDIVASSWIKEYKGNSIRITNEKEVSGGIFGRDELLKYIYMRDSYRSFAYMWNKLYRRELFEKKDGSITMFEENIKLGADVIFLAYAALHCERVAYIDKAFYHYNIREGSGSHSKCVNLYSDWIKSYEITIKMLSDNGINDSVLNYAKRFLAYHAWEGARVAEEIGDQKAKKNFQKIMRIYRDVYVALNRDHPERIEEYNKTISI